jgi:hypothetical protein
MRIVFFSLLFAGLVSSCSTDITLEGEWQDIPVIYGFLSTQDTAHYIRVEKVFLEPGGNAESIARIPDSLYYGPEEATVVLQKVSNGQRFVLQRVDGEAEGYPRREGVFAQSPNVLYKIKANQAALQGGQRVRILVERPGEETAIAETVIVSPLSITQPREATSLQLIPYNIDNVIVWDSPAQAQIFDVRATIRYRESLPGSTTQFVNKSIEWVFDENVTRDNPSSFQDVKFTNVSFYLTLADAITPNPQVIRRLDGIDFFVTGGGEELADYLLLANANTGITSAEQPPVYSNVTNGLGLVSSRFQVKLSGISINSTSRDSLRNGIYTKLLNFVP